MLIRILLTATLACTLVSAHAQTLVCGRTTRPPAIDADPADPCWQQAMIATDFSILGSGGTERAFRQTTVRATWDDRALYLHAILLEPDPPSITADVTERDGSVWLEDALELFLVPDTSTTDYLHFIVNAKGTLYDERNTDGSYDSQTQVSTRLDEQAWHAEMAIPWADLDGTPKAGDEWGFNVGREHRPKEPKEWSTWAPLEPKQVKFDRPALFGRLRFAAEPTPGRASNLNLPEGLAANPAFTDATDGKPAPWALNAKSTFGEIVPLSRHYAIRNDGDYGIVSQPIDVPVKAGDVFTVFTVMRGGGGATGGVAVVQEREDGRPDDLYPYWNRELTEDFRLYVGRIVVDKGAKRLFSIRLYRSNRKGWVEYAYCQVVPGLHGGGGIFDAEECTTSEQRGLGEPWSTPALTPFKPLSGGPIKALIFIGEFQRDAVELAQRLHLDYDLVYCPTFRGSGKVDQVTAFHANVIMQKLARREYQLIVLAGRPSDADVIDGILDSVRAGTGLVAIQPVAGGEATDPEQLGRLLDELPTEAADTDQLRDVLGGLSTDVLTQTSSGTQILKSLCLGDIEEGRVARLTWAEGTPGLIPFRPGVCEWWEYRWAALAKTCLWAAKRKSPGTIERLQCDGRHVTVRARSDARRPLTVSVRWDCAPLSATRAIPQLPNYGIGTDREVVQSLTVPAEGLATAAVPVPPELARMQGPHLARIVLRDDNGPLDVAACVVPSGEPRVILNSVEGPRTARGGEAVTIAVGYRAQVAGAIQADLVDAFDRVVSHAAVPLEIGDERTIQLALRVREPLSVYHRVVVTARDGDIVADRKERDLFVPAANQGHLDRFRLGVGYAAMHVRCPEYLHDQFVGFLRHHGVESATVNEYMIQRGMPAFGGMAGAGMRYSGASNVRDPSFSDPAQLAAMVKRTVEKIGAKRQWGFFAYNMDDEVHLHQGASVEVDASEHALRAFRSWVEQEYKSIDAANAQWSTEYDGFDGVKIPLLADMAGTANPARWVDFRLFMEREWANAYAAAHKAVRETYPEVNMSFTNPYKYNSLSATNFALWAPHEEVQLRYCHRHVLDRARSWSKAPILSWFGYKTTAAQCGHFVWNLALNGGACAIWWDPVEPWAYSGKSGFTPWYMLGPLWRETGRSRAVTEAARDLQGGLGKLLRVAEPAPPEALIVHSQPSMHALYWEAAAPKGRPVNEGYTRYAASDEAMAQCLIRHALSYKYVLPGNLDAESLRGVKLIALPSCVALPDEAVANLRRFVEAGGKLVADAMPATHTEHGKPRASAFPMASLFERQEAICLGQSANADSANALDRALSSMGVEGAVRWRTADGKLPKHTRLYRFRLGAAQYLGLIRNADEDAEEDGKLTIDLPEERVAYDCLTGDALGRQRQLNLDIDSGKARFLALLPYSPRALQVQALQVRDDLVLRASVDADVQPTDHVLHFEVTPAGLDTPALALTRDADAKGGKAELSVPLAISDPAGTWTVTVRDAATGLTATATVEVSPPQA